MRFIHTADWQLGMSRRFLGDESQVRYDDDRLGAVRRLGELATEHGAEFVVVAGDVFEHNVVERKVVSRALEVLKSLEVPVYLLPGNHDPLDQSSVFSRDDFAARPPHVHVVDSTEPIAVADGVELVGVPWRSKRPDPLEAQTLLAQLEPAAGRRIVLLHGGTDIVYGGDDEKSGVQIPAAVLDAAVERGAADYIALGDRHSTTRVGGTGRVWYSGSPETTNFDDREHDSGNVLLVDLSGDGGCTVSPLAVGRWDFRALHHFVDSEADLEALASGVEAIDDKSRTVLKIALTGTVGMGLKAKVDQRLERWSDIFAAAYLRDRLSDLAVLPDDTDFADLVSGYAAEAARDLVAAVERGGDEGADASGALSLLYRLAGGGR